MVRERDLKAYLLKQAKEHNVLARKVVWEGRDSAPDWVLMAKAPNPYLQGRTVWAELKATGEMPNSKQLREHARMREHGQVVVVLDSVEKIDDAIAYITA